MNTNTINKDNVGSATLLAAMFLTITVAVFSGAASANPTNVAVASVPSLPSLSSLPKAQAPARAIATKTTTDTLVITATRLK